MKAKRRLKFVKLIDVAVVRELDHSPRHVGHRVAFVITQEAMPFGNAVSVRFLERPTNAVAPKYTIPPNNETRQP
jgi:hypothetical protein